jgi:hypothetical protein
MAAQTIVVFSSGASPLYARNVLEAISMPIGSTQVVRYSERWIQPSLASHWDASLTNLPVLMHFVLQHPDGYFPPVLFPIRAGVVRRAWIEGSSYFLSFDVDDDVSVTADSDADTGVEPSTRLRAYTDAFKSAELPHPKKTYAALVDTAALPSVSRGTADSAIFERNTALLSKATPFEQARFLRVLRVSKSDGTAVPYDRKESAYIVEPNRTYRIELLSHQPGKIHSEESFGTRVEGVGATIQTGSRLMVASRYDHLAVVFQTASAAPKADNSASIVVEPSSDMYGPRVVMPLLVRLPKRRAYFDVGSGTAAVALLAAPGPLAQWSFVAAAIAFVAAVGAALYLQLYRGLSTGSTTGLAKAVPTASGGGSDDVAAKSPDKPAS